MGLDMYLSAQRFISGYSFSKKSETTDYEAIIKQFGIKGSTEAPSATVSINIGYWRKANAIHGWFVRECGGGVDECQPIYVPREKLLELRNLCLASLANRPRVLEPSVRSTVSVNPKSGEELMKAITDEWTVQTHEAELNNEDDTDPLRPTGGFFFGSTARDEWYYEDLSNTVEIINEALAIPENWMFEYRASW